MKKKGIFLVILIFSAALMPLSAQKKEGSQTVSLFEVDRLIRRTEYDEALRLLNIYIKANPENFDAAQQRIKRIMNARINYAELAEKLIYLIQTDPGNDKEIYELTRRLESFEKNPSDENLKFIADLKKSAEFNYFRAEFMNLQEQGAQLAASGAYGAAIDKIKEGFWLYKDDFYETWEQRPEFISQAEEILANLDKSLKIYQEKNYLSRIQDSVDAFVKAVNSDMYDEALQRYSEIKAHFASLSAVRSSVTGSAEALQALFEEIQKENEDVSDASYLPFLYRFITGISSIDNSGILGLMDLRWNSFIGEMNTAVFAMLNEKYQAYSLGISKSYTESVGRYSSLEAKVLSLYDLTMYKGRNVLDNPYEDYLIKCIYLDSLAGGTQKLAEVCREIDSVNKELEALIRTMKDSNSDADDSTLDKLFSSIVYIAQMLGVKEEQELNSVSWGNDYHARAFEDWAGLEKVYTDNLSYAFEESLGIANTAWTEIGSAFGQRSDDFVAYARKYLEAVKIYQEGLDGRLSKAEMEDINSEISSAVNYSQKTDELELGIKYSYPDLAVKLADYTRNYINKSISAASSYSSQMKENYNAHIQWKNDEDLESVVNNSLSYIDERRRVLLSLLNEVENQEKIAYRKQTSAQLAKNEGDIRFAEAENALKNNNFDVARRKLQDSLAKYNESLMNQDDEGFSLDVDKKLLSLGERITKAENEVVVREVRELKNLAKDSYFNGRFDDAEKYLNEAKNRWAVTNVQEDEEIKTLLAFVETALSMNTGRVILPSAPQYPEMSQLLNISNQYYDDGCLLLKKGDKAGAEEAFRSSLSNIRKVQYVYPLNQQAALLTLKINRELDEKKFMEEFSQKIEAARLLCQKAETRQEGYANLLDYYELEPDYRGLKDLIYQVEIDIGIRRKPVTKVSQNNAKNLLSEAQRLFRNAGNDSAALKKALSAVDEVLALTPDDKSAMALKDSITTKIGGNTLPVLSTEEERLYQLAVQRLQGNNVVGARALVNQILKKPQNGNLQKIKDLIVKIEARS
ncbi:MAG: hypothetical protein IJ688_04205 [Treponema sp.]|nr:hypothetical protein [Treponema sp.]